MKIKHQIVIVGGGNAGISVAARLMKKDKSLDVIIIDPSDKHYYQPAYTLVGGGVYNPQKTERSQASVIPKGAGWIKESVVSFDPSNDNLTTSGGTKVAYDFMVVCPGIQLNWDGIEGLKASLGKNNVCSNYSFPTAPYTWEVVKNFKGGTAIFTSANTPVKCGGAPQKAMYMSADYFRRQGLLGVSDVQFCNAGKVIFGIEKYKNALQKVCDRYGIVQNHSHNLIKVDGEKGLATFEVSDADGNIKIVEKHFDMIHVTPPQSAPDFIKNSTLVNEKGWVDVDKHTLRHVHYHNIFGLGDVTNTPNAKTGAAIRKQAPVVVENLIATLNQKPLMNEYMGYGSCPLVTGRGKLILAEFDYSGQPTETFPFNQAKERLSMYLLKTKVLPWMYWNKILKGTA